MAVNKGINLKNSKALFEGVQSTLEMFVIARGKLYLSSHISEI